MDEMSTGSDGDSGFGLPDVTDSIGTGLGGIGSGIVDAVSSAGRAAWDVAQAGGDAAVTTGHALAAGYDAFANDMPGATAQNEAAQASADSFYGHIDDAEKEIGF